MRNLPSNPPNLFVSSELRDTALGSRPTGVSSQATQSAGQAASATNIPLPPPNHHATPSPVGKQATSAPPMTSDNGIPPENIPDGTNDSDTEMADARSSFEDQEEDTSDRDIIELVPNLFRLLDLVDEHGSGGIGLSPASPTQFVEANLEKMVIDQTSLHRLLNIVQPGSYDSVSKINFKSLDKLSIKATGLYGVRAEIVKYLKRVGCLSDDAAMFLSSGAPSTTTPSNTLRSGLYLALQPELGLQGTRSKQAYIVYWPEETTWDDQAASSSVRRNRVTFMRYLTKLTEQIVALVSPEQANKFVWDTGARNKDLPADQMENDDESRLFSFEVSKSLEQEEDAIGHTGFKVQVEPKHLSKNPGSDDIRFVPGEQKAALLVSIDEPSRMEHKPFHNELINQMSLEKMIKSNTAQIQLGDLGYEDLMNLAKNGLREKHPVPFQKFDRCIREDKVARSEAENLDVKKVDELIRQDTPMVRQEIQSIIRRLYDELYPSLNVTMDMSHTAEASAALQARYTGLRKVENDIKQKQKLDRVADKQFKALKLKWLLLRDYLTADPVPPESEQADFVNDVLNGAHETSGSKSSEKSSGGSLTGFLLSTFGLGHSQDAKSKSNDASKSLSDPAFVAQLRPLRESFPVLEEITKQIYGCLESNLLNLENKILQDQVDKVVSAERKHQLAAASEARSINSKHRQDEVFKTLVCELKDAMVTTAQHVIWVESLEKATHGYGAWNSGNQYRWSGEHVIARGPQIRHLIYPLQLTEQDSQLCQSYEAHVPSPKLETRHKFEFTLAKNRNIEFLQLVRDKCLAVISERGKSHIYIEDNLNLDQSINKKPGKVTLNHDSLGGPWCLFALDQTTRLLAIIHGEKELKLSVYIFDELFGGLRSRGSPIPLKGWYDASVRIDKVCFVSGTEEVCLIENTGRARIFSLITQQFRPASLQIGSSIVDAFSAPDGSCLLVTVGDQEAQQPRERLLAFHWASFGSKQNGIHVTDLPPSDATRVATRLEGRGRNHILTFSSAARSVTSVAVQVKQKATEFSFRSNHDDTQTTAAETFNNSLIDCHLEVWTRFPVVPAVSRCTLSPVNRQPRKLVFQSSAPLAELGDYFARMISSFERSTRKPMDGTLSSISVSASADGATSLNNDVSEFLFGSFIVELLCLIPLHLAITRDNRFIPLKDGVWDPAYERSLLGADVPAIIDALSLGWYESLFQSYMATKACVHSIERSAQEDALLVLFRNNFALSRDIAGLFTSFQSSAMVLDPNANKGLFNSTLAIIIKDVTNSDAKDIVKEFSLKFRQIVEKEQDQNFISRLHRGRIQIIPWPVINSPGFYTLFRQLRQKLDQQLFTHGTAGAFLHNLKTLMAKIKAQDWGALDQNLAAHRAQQLLERLPRALCDGRTQEGPLKNMDTDEELGSGDGGVSFFVPEFTGGTNPENDASVEVTLRALVKPCSRAAGPRQHVLDGSYVEAIQDLIYENLDRRVDCVRDWATANVARFPSTNQDIRNLFSKINSVALAMRAAVRICSATCSNCQLHCLRPHRHADEEHRCGTDHRCVFDCAIAEEHSGRKPCGLP
ncbi:Vacuolar protein sorting-associated protein 13A [Ceratobasidium sp. 392]|nr:Vacuolar protein sorting-associated protein 13A [Ceratobasidium sp. 392]